MRSCLLNRLCTTYAYVDPGFKGGGERAKQCIKYILTNLGGVNLLNLWRGKGGSRKLITITYHGLLWSPSTLTFS